MRSDKHRRKLQLIDLLRSSNKQNTTLEKLPDLGKPKQSGKIHNRITSDFTSAAGFLTYASKSKEGVNPLKSYNQDSYFVCEQISPGMSLFGVCDGHGVQGHLVSNAISQNFPSFLRQSLGKLEMVPAMKRAVSQSQQLLVSKPDIDASYSGSTLAGVLIMHKNLVCANVGDSRAVIGRRNGAIWTIRNLSNDHRLQDPNEKRRIQLAGGIVNRKRLGPLRVWIPHTNAPGLAVSRAMGDLEMKTVGVTAAPDVFKHKLSRNDMFVVVASDGLWEVLNNHEVLNIVKDLWAVRSCEDTLNCLVEEAHKRWERLSQNIDDITVILIYLI